MSNLQKLLTTALIIGLALSQRASGQQYGISGPFATVGAGTCTMTGIADLTNTCNNIYLLMGVLK